MDENILTWNLENWVTVVLMAAIGFALLRLGQNYWQKRADAKAAQNAAA